MMASGLAGLGYQIVWTQQCALWLGHESAAVLAVVTAFFGGLALGALLMGPRIERSGHAVRWYAACEVVIAAWGLVLLVVMAPFSTWLLNLTGVQPTPLWQWWLAFSGTFLLLLPATAAMGATLPAMERVTSQMHVGQRSIAALYASNTFGAVLGVLGATFWLVPELGLMRTAIVCVALNVLCAGAALLVFSAHGEPPSDPARSALPVAHGARGTLLRLAMAGLLGIGYEVLVVRVLSQVAEDTVYTFAMLLAVYLVGTALGAAAYQRWLARAVDADRLADRLLSALAMACLLGTASLWAAEWLQAWVLQAGGGEGMALAIGAEAVLALMAFGLPTLVMGALFSHLSASARAAGVSFGRALGVNTLAAALAPPLFGVLLAPMLGPKLVLLGIASAYLLLGTRRAWLTPWVWTPAVAALAMTIWAPPLAFITVPEGGHVVSYRDGVMAAVSVVEDAEGVARLRINNRQQEGSTSSRLVDARQALLPLLLHPSPQRALFLGLGTGVTSRSAAQDPRLQVDVVELLPEVIEASQHFKRVFDGEGPAPPINVMAADARRYVRASHQTYDVIVSDNFQPARSGSGALYTVEHFRAVRERLAEGGVFCQWLPLHQLDLATLRSIVKSFTTVYPGAWAILASNSLETPVIGLVGRADGGGFDPALLRQRLAASQMPIPPAAFGIEDEFALLGSMVAGPKALAHFAGEAAANTDDVPVVTYRAPRITYAPDSLPRDRLIALLNELSVMPEEVFDAAADQAWSDRMAAYWAARTQFIVAGRAVRPAGNVQDMLSQVREPLLSVLRTSPYFRPAYDPLLRMAGALSAGGDVPAGRALLTELARVQPDRPEAAQALAQMPDARP
ncbi:fused MFS/spermidine synthase [Aquabacterium sp.]|uniref:fused MFS/spermidine synthase n=1 Tax=Aquabacterium sp. TaxID=1872578 RepID=UPI0025BA4237|nr:fused MFS/spermidine synthase [Aquabacterium sp.]